METTRKYNHKRQTKKKADSRFAIPIKDGIQNLKEKASNDNTKKKRHTDLEAVFVKQWFTGGSQSPRLRKPGCGHCYLRFFHRPGSMCGVVGLKSVV